MHNIMFNSTIAVLLSLGISACSINTGRGSQGENTPNITNNTLSIDATSGDNSNENSNTTPSAPATPPPSIATDLTHPTFNITGKNIGTQAATYLSSKEKQTELQTKINALNNVSIENCNAQCNQNAFAAGDVVKAYHTSYANYAVVREAYDRDNRATPTNSYIATVITPTVERSAVVNATYKGTASWSGSNRFNVNSDTGLTLTVTDNKISGQLVRTAATNSGETPTLMTFNSADIAVKDGVVGFEGSATFYKRMFNTSAQADLTGSYKGYFAGPNAEEVIGTFQSNEETNSASVQGAFSATK